MGAVIEWPEREDSQARDKPESTLRPGSAHTPIHGGSQEIEKYAQNLNLSPCEK